LKARFGPLTAREKAAALTILARKAKYIRP